MARSQISALLSRPMSDFGPFSPKAFVITLPIAGQLSNLFVEGMRKIYELECFIKMQSSLADERDKASNIYKRAV